MELQLPEKSKRSYSSSSESSGSSSGKSSSSFSSSSSSNSLTNERKRLKKEKKKTKKEKKELLKKEKKMLRKEKKKMKKKLKEQMKMDKKKIKDAKTCDDLFDVPIQLMDRSKNLAPMTKEEWEKKQSVVRRVYDEATGRNRLIKGDGEIIEEVVSKERHKAINQQATKADGNDFEAKLRENLKK